MPRSKAKAGEMAIEATPDPKDFEFAAALTEIAVEQAAWRVRRKLPVLEANAAAKYALIRWIGENCCSRPRRRAVKRG